MVDIHVTNPFDPRQGVSELKPYMFRRDTVRQFDGEDESVCCGRWRGCFVCMVML